MPEPAATAGGKEGIRTSTEYRTTMYDDNTRETPQLLLSPRETARALGISERTLAQRTAEGVFPIVKIGRLTRYDVGFLRQWIRDHTERKTENSENHVLTPCQ